MRNIASGVVMLGLLATVGCGQPAIDTGAADTLGAPEPLYDMPAGGMTLQLVEEAVPIAELTMQDLAGRPIATDDLRGKVTLVNFWATWCGPCREEIPDLIALQDRYPNQLQVIGVSADEGDLAKVEEFAREWGMNYPIVMATPEIHHQFPGVFALPTSFVVDPDGQIVQTHVGLIDPAVIEQEVRHLTSLPTNVNIELIEKTTQMRLADAAHATEIPGLDLSELTPAQRELALQRLNEEGCNCGCQLTLAQCRINDQTCDFSLPLAQQVIAEIVGAN